MGFSKKIALPAVISLIATLLLLAGVLYFHKREEKRSIVLYGNVDVRQVDIGFRVYGKVNSMPFEEGDFVPKGAFMASIEEQPYEDLALKAGAALEAAVLTLENAEQIFLRRQELVGEGGVSQEDYDNAQTALGVAEQQMKEATAALGVAKTDLRNTKAICPADGTILTRVREPGTVVLQGEPVYTLSLISPVWVRAYVPEPLLGVIYPGMPADVFTDTKGGKVYKGKIGFISPVAEFTPKTVESTELRTDLVYRIRVYADNPDWGLKQGMPVTVHLRPEKKP
ncbi:MAG: efflux RND transporter periplasmic adaptor subunit [Chlamydiae bacterium]|nr:efflux RND transporter periplasmic adaptor subunit [Chlamydiota bacterium]